MRGGFEAQQTHVRERSERNRLRAVQIPPLACDLLHCGLASPALAQKLGQKHSSFSPLRGSRDAKRRLSSSRESFALSNDVLQSSARASGAVNRGPRVLPNRLRVAALPIRAFGGSRSPRSLRTARRSARECLQFWKPLAVRNGFWFCFCDVPATVVTTRTTILVAANISNC